MNDIFKDHFFHPRNTGVMADAHGAGKAGDAGCGVVFEFFLRFADGSVESARCQASGSSAAVACGSLLTEMVTGEGWRRTAAISEDTLTAALAGDEDVKPSLETAAMFAVESLHAALEDSVRNNRLPFASGSSDSLSADSVLVAMSGGVDSSVACLLVRDSGRETTGMTMRLWSDPDCAVSETPTCCSPQAIRDARAVCHSLGLPHLTVDYRDEFASTVVDAFLDGYLAGQTPNPCTRCNGSFRFPALVALADRLGMSKVATGHYARLSENDGLLLITRAADGAKDQSYMLWGIEPVLLERLEFPLGDISKDETRAIAREAGLEVHDRPESQEVCFIPDNDYRRFVRSRASASGKESLLPGEGEIVDECGNKLGSHRGFIDFTVGQRHGLGVSAAEPLYVIRTNPDRNQVVAGSRKQLAVRHITVSCVNYFVDREILQGDTLAVQVRYNSGPAPVKIIETVGDLLRIELEVPVSGVAPGQSAVFYRKGVLLAGGVIEKTV